MIAAGISTTHPALTAPEPAETADWAEVNRTFAAFALPLPELTQAEPDYVIRRHSVGGGRKDVLTLGKAEDSGAQLMIELYRPGRELTVMGRPLGAIKARAKNLGAIDSPRPAGTMPSKFGPFSLIDFTTRDKGWLRHCLGFVRVFDAPRMQIAGWYCRPGPEIVERSLPACALDRLTLLAGGSDPRLGELFAKAELKRDFCGQKSTYLLPAMKPPHWITDGEKPKLRGRMAGR